MRAVWLSAALAALFFTLANADSHTKKSESKNEVHDAKKEAVQDIFLPYVLKKEPASASKVTILDENDESGSNSIVMNSVAFSNLQRLAASHQLMNESKTISVGPFTITPGLPGFGGGVFPFPDLANPLATIFAIAAAIGAGLAALIAFIVPPLQIANQILAIIALALLGAYLAEDKGLAHYFGETGYDDTGYSGYSFSSSGSSGGYDDDHGYGSSNFVGSDHGQTSSYSDYRRSGLAPAFDGFSDLYGSSSNSLDGKSASESSRGSSYGSGISARSHVARSIVNTVAKMVTDAVKKYTNLYGE